MKLIWVLLLCLPGCNREAGRSYDLSLPHDSLVSQVAVDLSPAVAEDLGSQEDLSAIPDFSAPPDQALAWDLSGPGCWYLVPPSYDFGQVKIITCKSAQFVIGNKPQCKNVQINQAIAEGPGKQAYEFIPPKLPFVLPPASSKLLVVKYCPIDSAGDLADIIITTDDQAVPVGSLRLTGLGKP
jgi:hypothetical protein